MFSLLLFVNEIKLTKKNDMLDKKKMCWLSCSFHLDFFSNLYCSALCSKRQTPKTLSLVFLPAGFQSNCVNSCHWQEISGHKMREKLWHFFLISFLIPHECIFYQITFPYIPSSSPLSIQVYRWQQLFTVCDL